MKTHNYIIYLNTPLKLPKYQEKFIFIELCCHLSNLIRFITSEINNPCCVHYNLLEPVVAPMLCWLSITFAIWLIFMSLFK